MASFNGVNAAKIAASVPSLPIQGQQAGRVHVMYDEYTLLADLAASDVINMGAPIPEGARLVGCKLVTEALGGSCTLNVGWAAGTDPSPAGNTQEAAAATGFFSAVAVSSASAKEAFAESTLGSYFNKVLTSAVQIQVAENAVSSGATGKKIKLEVSYVID